jgi:hypothetical protein
MLSILTFASDSVGGILAYPLQVFEDLKLAIILIIGLPLAFWVIKKVIVVAKTK